MSPAGRSTVLFDLDGTLIDSSADLAAALNHVLRTDGLAPFERREVLAMVGDGAAALVAHGYRERGARPPDDALDRYRRHYARHCLDHTRPYDGIPELLARLAPGRTLAVVTNKPAAFAEQVVAGLGLERWFAAVVGPEAAPRRKPSPEHVLAALAAVGRKPEEAIMVGDAPTDVAAGRGAATATVAVTWGYRVREELEAAEPDHLVTSVAELEEVLTAG